jgi:hypothetical protein
MQRRRFVLGLPLMLALGACVYAPPYAAPPGYGPPPHAPAHGYRHQFRPDLMLVFDAGRGLYLVDGWPGHYYHGDRFYRARVDGWHWSPHLRGPWSPVTRKRLPPGLAKKRR